MRATWSGATPLYLGMSGYYIAKKKKKKKKKKKGGGGGGGSFLAKSLDIYWVTFDQTSSCEHVISYIHVNIGVYYANAS